MLTWNMGDGKGKVNLRIVDEGPMDPQKEITKPSLETLYLSSEKKITCMEVMGKHCF